MKGTAVLKLQADIMCTVCNFQNSHIFQISDIQILIVLFVGDDDYQ